MCAIFNGIAGIVVFSAPSAVSSAWFPPHERTTATGIALVFNNLGNAVSFLAAPAIVPDPGLVNNTLVQQNETGQCPVLLPEQKLLIEHRVNVLMYLGELI